MIDFTLSTSTRWRADLTRLPVLPPSDAVRVRVVWDDESEDWNFKSRTQHRGFVGPDNPPAVWRFFPQPLPNMGDFRVNISDWKAAMIELNGGGEEGFRRWEYLVDPKRATFNSTGWAQQAYLTMSGNILEGEFIGTWFRFKTLRPSDLPFVAGWTHQSHPHLIQKFTCVTWKRGDDGVFYTHHIESSGTPRGQVYWYLVTKEGVAYIPRRQVVRL